jgi:pilus assembly protein TadC
MEVIIAVVGGMAVWMLSAPTLEVISTTLSESRQSGIAILGTIARVCFRRVNATESAARTRKLVEDKLRLAGRRQEFATEQYIEQAQGAGVAVAALMFFMLLLLGSGFFVSLVLGGIGGIIAWWLQKIRVNSWIADRRRRLSQQFPYFLDLAVMTMDSGMGFVEVVESYVATAPDTELAKDLGAVASDLKMGMTLEHALMSFDQRVPSEDVIAVTRAVRQGLRMGTPLAQVMNEQAESMRFKRSQLAERGSEELKVKLQGPTMMLVVAVMILVLGPAIVSMAQGGH